MKLILTKYGQRNGVFAYEDGHLTEANIYDECQKLHVGDIYLAQVIRRLPNIQAYFVKLDNMEVFLPFSETDTNYKAGDKIIIQIKKEASKGKQALCTCRLSLKGMYCVVHALNHFVGVSSKMNEDEKALWIDRFDAFLNSDKFSVEERELLLQYYVIIRTNAMRCANTENVFSEWLNLSRKLNEILKQGICQKPNAKLYGEEGGYISYIKNVPLDTLEEIITDDKMIYESIMNCFRGNDDLKIRFYTDDYPLSKLYSLESRLQEALNKKVWLKCGGFLLIEPTEALTVIDVNSGKCEKGASSEAYYKKINFEAAMMIARQIKLRNISGIIVIDFINMSSSDNRKELLQVLSEETKKDKVATRVIGMTKLGLVEMTRSKIAKPLWEQISFLRNT